MLLPFTYMTSLLGSKLAPYACNPHYYMQSIFLSGFAIKAVVTPRAILVVKELGGTCTADVNYRT